MGREGEVEAEIGRGVGVARGRRAGAGRGEGAGVGRRKVETVPGTEGRRGEVDPGTGETG